MQYRTMLAPWRAVVTTCCALGLFALSACDKENAHKEVEYKGAVQENNLPWWQVAQGWDYQSQMGFWFQPQGARQMPYVWFLILEQENSTQLFRSDANIERLRYIPAPKMPGFNEDALPIGFTKSEKPDERGVYWMGMTCAACHTAKLNLGGEEILIDGGPGLGDYVAYNTELVNALVASYEDDAKFKRFATKVLGENYTEADASKLRNEMEEQSMEMAALNELNHSSLAYGYGRVDAFGAILNRVVAEDIGVPENKMEANAPVSYPFLWGTPQSSVVQWNGSAPNNKDGAGPLFRNVGEVVGVNGVVEVKPADSDDFIEKGDVIDDFVSKASYFGYASSVNLPNVGQIEEWLQELRSPKWPQNLLPEIDKAKATKGKKLYGEHCVGCHHVVARKDEAKPYDPVMVPITELGADPRMAANFLYKKNPKTGEPWKSGKLEGSRLLLVTGEKYGATLPSRGEALVTLVSGVTLGHPLPALEADYESYYSRHKEVMNANLMSYKARPLTGIWATAPYMHNGSVPNLYEMLLPEEDRTKNFYVGSRRFDPVRVGYEHDEAPNTFAFDTTLDGNRNTGHNVGKALTDDERWAIVEYLKTL
ncbi:cytochrome c [Kordiimonas aestuarii]|uniref:cytochrome c n=1 Tax=Kordiimonas aestuarii TaxID=1005925 RepID=UPI0021D03120|nr:cytochrome c [Kordiimonas aestuarii]